MTTTDNIYVRLIDGVESWVPVKTDPLGENKYLILEIEVFDATDHSSLFEFIPGDIVDIESHLTSNHKSIFVAKNLVKQSDNPNKKYLDFLFKATIKAIPIDLTNKNYYSVEIDRALKSQIAGKFLYHDTLDTITKLKACS